MTLLTPIDHVSGVGARRASAFRRLGIPSVAHLVHHIPARYEHQEAEASVNDLPAGSIVSVRGEITHTRVVTYRKPRFHATLADHTGTIDLVWFNQPYLSRRLYPGARIRVQGKAKRMGRSGLQIANPTWELLPADDERGPERRDERLRPVYPATEDLTSDAIEKTVEQVLDAALPLISDHLDPEYCSARALPSLADAYRSLHRPESRVEIEHARRRLIYDELLLLQLGVHMKREHIRRTMRAPALRFNEAIDRHIRDRLPFQLTEGQDQVVRQLAQDLSRDTPANRLIQGDVGAGKTVVALYAMLLAVATEHQATLMAPTELLAEQHYLSIRDMLKGSAVKVELLTGSVTGAARSGILEKTARGDIDILIGTHALLTDDVRFARPAVNVIDEQHRFGVHQRARMRSKSDDETLMPHTLVMTATPIPRTLSLTIFGDLDVSTIRGLPPGRQPVTTRAITPAEAGDAYAAIRARIDRGEQAYVIVPAIEDGAASGLRDVGTVVRYLQSGPLEGKHVAALHGRLKSKTREHIMERFRLGRIDALVATTVIEVGVDVPNATVIVIEHAERFGLAQLHQLRGRVGRGDKPSECILVTDPTTPDSEERIGVMTRTTDGFLLAEEDLRIRGPGEVFGARQSGAAPFRLAEFPRDMELLMMARRDAAEWIERSPALDGDQEELIRKRLMKAHGEALGLVDVA